MSLEFPHLQGGNTNAYGARACRDSTKQLIAALWGEEGQEQTKSGAAESATPL